MPVVQKKTTTTFIFPFSGGDLGSQNPARTIAHSPPGVKETLNYWLREKKQFLFFGKYRKCFGLWKNDDFRCLEKRCSKFALVG